MSVHLDQAKVLPCPFCGGRKVITHQIGPGRYTASCSECGGRGPSIEDQRFLTDHAAGTRMAAAKWNLRK